MEQNQEIKVITDIILMLTAERRVRFQTLNNGAVPVIEVTTNNRDYGKICGSAGATIKDIKTLAASMESPADVILMPADQNLEKRHPSASLLPQSPVEILEDYLTCLPLSEVPKVIDGHGGEVEISIDLTRGREHALKPAIERVFFNIGRACRSRCVVKWG